MLSEEAPGDGGAAPFQTHDAVGVVERDATNDEEDVGEFDEVTDEVLVGVRVRVGDIDAVFDSDVVPLLLAVIEALAPRESVAVGVAVIL